MTTKEEEKPKMLVKHFDIYNVGYIENNNRTVFKELLTNQELKDVFNVLEDTTTKGIKLNFIATSKFPIEYLEMCIHLAKELDHDSLTFEMGNNYPIQISCEEFKFVIAPRIENE
jgi:hypothetical protein